MAPTLFRKRILPVAIKKQMVAQLSNVSPILKASCQSTQKNSTAPMKSLLFSYIRNRFSYLKNKRKIPNHKQVKHLYQGCQHIINIRRILESTFRIFHALKTFLPHLLLTIDYNNGIGKRNPYFKMGFFHTFSFTPFLSLIFPLF